MKSNVEGKHCFLEVKHQVLYFKRALHSVITTQICQSYADLSELHRYVNIHASHRVRGAINKAAESNTPPVRLEALFIKD
jgi:hypothetical protein